MKRTQGKPQPLGAVKTQGKVNFAVAVPAGKTCELLLYRKERKKPVQIYEMQEEAMSGEVRFLALERFDPEKYEYNYRIQGKVTADPFVKGLAGQREFGQKTDFEKHEMRGYIPSDGYDWEGDSLLRIPYHDVIAYSLHIRGFTKHVSSGAKHPGTFAGVTEKIPYLQELGINQIQCMPVYEFEETDGNKTNYWGYGKGYFFAPKATYSTSGDPVTELKDMVKACHKAGIEVVFDMPFAQGMLPQDTVACLVYYMTEFHADGFILNPYVVSWEAVTKEPMLKGVKIMQKDDTFQTVMRRFLKGDAGMNSAVISALMRRTEEDGKYNYITGHTGFTMRDLVSYNEKHNMENGEMNADGPGENYSWNCGEEGPSCSEEVLQLRKQQMKNAFILLLLAQGMPCILAGDEFGNTQMGNNNVYCQDNEISWLNWEKDKDAEELLQFVKEMIKIRRQHRFFCQDVPLTGKDRAAFGVPDLSFHGESAWKTPAEAGDRQLSVMYSDVSSEDVCLVMYNMYWGNLPFALPALPKKMEWQPLIATAEISPAKKKKDEAEAVELRKPETKLAGVSAAVPEVETVPGAGAEIAKAETMASKSAVKNIRIPEEQEKTGAEIKTTDKTDNIENKETGKKEETRRRRKKGRPQIITEEPDVMEIGARSIVILVGRKTNKGK